MSDFGAALFVDAERAIRRAMATRSPHAHAPHRVAYAVVAGDIERACQLAADCDGCRRIVMAVAP